MLAAAQPGGLRAAELSQNLFGVADRTITVRAEISRLRKHFGGLLCANPYRFADGVVVRDTRFAPTDGRRPPSMSAVRLAAGSARDDCRTG